MNNRRTYKLPNGDVVTDVARYLEAWDEVTARALSFFPGWTCVARDPSIVIARMRRTQLDVLVEEDRVTLSPEAVRAMRAPPDAPNDTQVAALRAENNRLKDENWELRRGRGGLP